jgi:hypothetical protein
MKNLMCKLAIRMFICSSLMMVLSFYCEAKEMTIIDDRIDIYADELLISDSGLFLIRSGEILPITALFVDSEGLFIRESMQAGKVWEHNTCLNGHEIWHKECRGCAHWFCPFRCKCYSPW